MMFIFILEHPQPPQGRLQGGGLEGVYHQKSCVMSILGFSIVGNPKMITIFHFRVTPPPKGVPRGVWGARGGIPPKIMCYVNSEVLNSGNSKMTSIFNLGYPQPPKGAPGGGIGGLEGVYHQKSCVMSILGF